MKGIVMSIKAKNRLYRAKFSRSKDKFKNYRNYLDKITRLSKAPITTETSLKKTRRTC